MMWIIKSLFNNFLRRLAQIMEVIKVPTVICVSLNKIHHRIVLKEIMPILNKARSYVESNRSNIITSQNDNQKIIWTLWWQGYSQMPDLVKACHKSLLIHSNNHKVVLITKNNIKHYINFPNYVYKKINKHQISLTHLSDLIRFNLLNRYGGLWIDATIFLSSDLTRKYFRKFYTTSVKLDKFHFSVSDSKWTGFLIGGNKQLPLFTFMNKFFKLYWNKYNHLIDYFLIDYAIFYAYCKNIGGIKVKIDKDDYQPHLFDLMPLMNNKYNNQQYKMLQRNTEVFKLTYKKKLNSHDKTYYYYLLNNDLNR